MKMRHRLFFTFKFLPSACLTSSLLTGCKIKKRAMHVFFFLFIVFPQTCMLFYFKAFMRLVFNAGVGKAVWRGKKKERNILLLKLWGLKGYPKLWSRRWRPAAANTPLSLPAAVMWSLHRPVSQLSCLTEETPGQAESVVSNPVLEARLTLVTFYWRKKSEDSDVAQINIPHHLKKEVIIQQLSKGVIMLSNNQQVTFPHLVVESWLRGATVFILHQINNFSLSLFCLSLKCC